MKARYEYDAEEIQRLIEEDLRARGHSVVPGDVAVPQEYAVSVSVRAAAVPAPAPAPAPAPTPTQAPTQAPVVQAPSAAPPEAAVDAPVRPPPERLWNSIENVQGDPRFVPPPVRHDYVPRIRELGAPKDSRRLTPGNPWAGQSSDKQPRDPSASERLLDALYPDEGEAPPPPALDVLAGSPPVPGPRSSSVPRLYETPGAPSEAAGEGGIDPGFLDAFLKR